MLLGEYSGNAPGISGYSSRVCEILERWIVGRDNRRLLEDGKRFGVEAAVLKLGEVGALPTGFLLILPRENREDGGDVAEDVGLRFQKDDSPGVIVVESLLAVDRGGDAGKKGASEGTTGDGWIGDFFHRRRERFCGCVVEVKLFVSKLAIGGPGSS